MQFNQKNIKDWSYYHFPELEQKGIRHGFFTARSPSYVLQGEEKTEFLRNFGLADLIIMKQEHGVDVHIIEDGHRPESGDGLILLSRGIAGIVKTADCQPVILCEPEYPVASIIHAGWRGTVNKITKKAVEKMVQIGVDKKRIIALLGPSIGPCCYEVKNDVYNVFVEGGFSDTIFSKKNSSLFLDIRRANIEILQSEGVQNIYGIGLCTCCSQNLFNSYRGGEKEKRQINFVSIML
jgi:hypothetical protein